MINEKAERLPEVPQTAAPATTALPDLVAALQAAAQESQRKRIRANAKTPATAQDIGLGVDCRDSLNSLTA